MEKPRTIQQNSALHLFFEMLAQALNDAGLDQRKLLKPIIEIPWTKEAVKDQLWRPIQKAMYHKESTTELLKHEEIDKIHEVLMRELGRIYQVEFIPFPSNDINESNYHIMADRYEKNKVIARR